VAQILRDAGADVELKPIEQSEFYKAARTPARLSILNGAESKNMPLWHAFTPGIQSEAGWVLNPPILQQTKIFTHDPASPMVSAWESIVQKKKTVERALADAEVAVNNILAGK